MSATPVDSELRERIAANVRAEMARAGKGRTDLRRLLRTGRMAVHRRWHGEVPYSGEQLAAIAQHLQVPVSALLNYASKEAAA